MRLRDLRNLGPKSETWPAMVDILEPGQLAELGAVQAYRRLQDAAIPGLSLNALWAMEGALTGTDWRHIPPERKQELLAELAEHEPATWSRSRLEPGTQPFQVR